MDKQSIKEILDEYGLNGYEATERGNVRFIETNEGKKILKRVGYNRQELNFVISAMEHLWRRGFKNIAVPLKQRNGQRFVEKQGQCWFLTDYIFGRESDYSIRQDLREVTKLLARLHIASQGFEPPPAREDRILWGRWPQIFIHRANEMQTFAETIKKKKEQDLFDKRYLEQIPFYRELGFIAAEMVERSAYRKVVEREQRKKSLCHHDAAYHNFIIGHQNTPFVIDFDYCVCDIPLHDVASLIYRNVKKQDWLVQKAAYIISVYNKVNRIEAEEMEIIAGFLTFPQEFWQLGVWKYAEKQPWDLNKYLRLYRAKTGEYLERQNFLSQLKKINPRRL